MKTKPRPGERISDYVTRWTNELLLRSGASAAEAADFSEVLYCRFGRDVKKLSITDAKTLLSDWRDEMNLIASNVRRNRIAHFSAGYIAISIDSPIFLNGKAEW